MSAQRTPTEMFLSYADADEQFSLELEKHLGLLKREGLLTIWHKGLLGVGTDRNKEVNERLSFDS